MRKINKHCLFDEEVKVVVLVIISINVSRKRACSGGWMNLLICLSGL